MVFFPFLKHSVSGGACWATEATPYSILRTFLMRRKARVNLCSVPCTKGVREPRSSPSPSVSRSPPLPCSLNATNVFFTQLCAGLCVQACVAFPPSIASSHNTHTKTHTHTFQPQASANTAAAVVVVVVTLLVIALGMQQRHMWEHFVVT